VQHIISIMSGPATEVKLFGKWSLDDVEVNDISLVVSTDFACWTRLALCVVFMLICLLDRAVTFVSLRGHML
jgi:hypothetical protein